MKKHFNPEGNRIQLVYSLCYDEQTETLFFPIGISYWQNIPSDKRDSKSACITLDLLLFQIAFWFILRKENILKLKI